VEVVDLREELKSGNRGIFSRKLVTALSETLSRGQQSLLFLNRRGAATFVQCRNCGFVLRCKRCQVTLTHHSDGNTMLCHQCRYRTPTPAKCPECGSVHISFLGLGIQKVEQEAGAAFPEARLLRWDSDTADGRGYHDMMRKLTRHEVDVLIGTQMVAKGLDLPLLTLVGVVSADTSLGLPDFRAGEKAFQLLCQVAGRAGRSGAGGKAIIQTFNPEHYAIRAAARHDYLAFYNVEIGYRRGLDYPPFSRLACLTFAQTSEARARQDAERLKQALFDKVSADGISGISIIGPVPAFVSRLRGRYRWQLVLRGPALSGLLLTVPLPAGCTVDIDPVSLI
jgi:primosomal protein N' (replication factor Y)